MNTDHADNIASEKIEKILKTYGLTKDELRDRVGNWNLEEMDLDDLDVEAANLSYENHHFSLYGGARKPSFLADRDEE